MTGGPGGFRLLVVCVCGGEWGAGVVVVVFLLWIESLVLRTQWGKETVGRIQTVA